MNGEEYATGFPRIFLRGTFTSLAEATGFSEADCARAARSGLLADLVVLAEKRRHRRMPGRLALARVRQLENLGIM